jgi:hypothetical protein
MMAKEPRKVIPNERVIAQVPENTIPIETIKVNDRLLFIEELMSANPSENRSEVHKMIKQMVFDKASKHDEAKIVSENAGSKGGKRTAEQKRKANENRDAQIIKSAEDLKKTNASHEIAGKLAQRYGLSSTRIRDILRKAKVKHP